MLFISNHYMTLIPLVKVCLLMVPAVRYLSSMKAKITYYSAKLYMCVCSCSCVCVCVCACVRACVRACVYAHHIFLM